VCDTSAQSVQLKAFLFHRGYDTQVIARHVNKLSEVLKLISESLCTSFLHTWMTHTIMRLVESIVTLRVIYNWWTIKWGIIVWIC